MALPSVVDADDLSRVLGIDDRTVRRLTKKGVLQRGPTGYDLCDSVVAFVAHRESVASAAAGRGALGEAQTQVYQERAKTMRLTRERLEGSLVSRAETTSSWAAIFVLIRTRMMNIPAKTALRLASIKIPAEAKALLDAEIREALEDVANVEITTESKPGRRAGADKIVTRSNLLVETSPSPTL
jgi:hypothetical protein